jgi:YVTN family beta-propeller protein
VIEFRVLGSFEVVDADRVVEVGSPQQRALLTVLLLHRGEPVSSELLIDALWGEHAPASATKIVQGYVSNLRRAFGEGLLVTRGRSYVLQALHGQVDADRFASLVAEGQRALAEGDARAAAGRLREALALWRGPALADFSYEAFAQLEIARLEELRLGALEERNDAELALGEHARLVVELEALAGAHPLRERFIAQLMLALYRSGRQADALQRYRDARRGLVEELGIEPGPELQQLERAILEQDPALAPPRRVSARPPAAAALRVRRGGLLITAGGLILLAATIAAVLSLAGGGVRLAGDEVGAIATGSGQVISAVRIAAPPTSVAVGSDGAIWVASAAAGTLSSIDPKTQAITQIPVGSDPVAVTVAADGSIWVANSSDGTVSRVSSENDMVVGSPVSVGAGPSALVATPNAVWVVNTLSASVSKIDIASDRVVATIPVGSEPVGIAAGAGSVWVADEGDGTVYRLDQQTGAEVAAPIPVGDGAIGIAFGDGAAWVVNSTDGTLSRIDAQSNTVTAAITVGQGPHDVAVGPRRVWVSDEYGNAIAQVDPVTLAVVRTTRINSAPLGLALAGDRLWVATDGNGAAHRGGVLDALASGTNGPLGGDAPTIDPGSAYNTDIWRVLVMTSDGLVGYRREGGVAGNELVPDLAVALPAPTDDGLTYTFQIRSGIRYSNGVLLRASDFRRGLERAFRVGGGPVADLGLVVGAQKCLKRPASCDLSRGIVADDATDTVTVHLTQPDPDLFAQLTLSVAYPVPPGTGVSLPTRTVPGTGPYEISTYSPDLSGRPGTHGLLVLKRNPYFRQWSAAAQPAGFPDQIVVRTNYSQAEQVTAVEQGRADMTWDPPTPSEITALSQSDPSQLHQDPVRQTSYVWLDVRSAPFNHLLAREAFNYAVDRGALGQLGLGSNGTGGSSTCQLLPPDFPGYVPYCPYTEDPTASGRWLAPDLAKAQALVRESGTQGASVALLQPSFVSRRFGQALVATLRAIGYRARLVDLSPDTVFGSPPSFFPRFQAGLVGWEADYVAPAQVIPDLVGCSVPQGPDFGNFGHFCDPSIDAKIAAALSEESVNPGLASQEWTAIDRDIVDQAVDVPLDNQLNSDFVARRVGDYQYNPQWGVLVDQLWVR